MFHYTDVFLLQPTLLQLLQHLLVGVLVALGKRA